MTSHGNTMIWTQRQLVEHIAEKPATYKNGVRTEHEIPQSDWERSIQSFVYKYTTCGAWVYFTERGSIRMGSIVEGTELEATPIELFFPFTDEEFYEAMENIDVQCQHIWMITHGCPQCSEDGFGTEVNPACPECKGDGVVI